MNIEDIKKIKIPDGPGVYIFRKNKQILYIGKATSLRDRIKSYFSKDLIKARGPIILDMVTLATEIKWQETNSVLEALILEANLIKKYQPKYNTKEKDNKSFNYVCVTNEVIPRVLTIRGRNLKKDLYKEIFGPFPNSSQLKEGMKIIRRLFPYLDEQSIKKNNFEFYKQLGLVPLVGVTSKNAFEKVLGRGKREPVPDHFQKHFSTALNIYKKNIKNLILFFEGQKRRIISNMKKEMIEYAKNKEFEKAGEIKKKIFALEHINDIALIKEENITQQNFGRSFLEEERSDGKGKSSQNFRIDPVVDFGDAHSKRASHFTKIHYRVEAYDIAHMSGKNMVGVMTVIENGDINKNEYRKFIIKTINQADDTGALQEILERRFNHKEWRCPNLIVLDGGVAQINVAKKVLQNFKRTSPNINIVSVIKNEKHKPKAIMGDEKIIKQYRKEILLANNEAHRFAITFHKNRRNKNFIS